jgi:integrase
MRARGRRRVGRLYTRPGSAFYWYEVSFQGTTERRSTGQTDKKKAKGILDARVKELNAAEAGLIQLPSRGAEQVTVGQRLDALLAHFAIEGARSLRQMRSHLVPVRAAFGAVRVLDLTAEAIDAYVLQRQQAGAAPASINRGLQLVAQAVRPFCATHRQPLPVIRRLPERNVRQGFFEQADVEAMIAALPDPLADLTRFAYWSGWRRSEITGLTWAEVDLAARTIRLDPARSKTGEGRLLVIEGPLSALMARRWAARSYPGPAGVETVSPLVFHREGAPIVDFRKAWASACVAAGLYQVVTDENGHAQKVPSRLFHDLRRSAVRTMVNRGVPERVAMTVSGHKTRSVFDRYHIVTEQDQRDGAQRAWAPLEATPKAESNVIALKAAER